MKPNPIIRLLILVTIMAGCFPVSAQRITTEGTDFWVGFLPNAGNTGQTQVVSLFITGRQSTTGTVTVNNNVFNTTFTVTPGEVTQVELPTSLVISENNNETTRNLGIHVTTEQPVSLYASNYITYTADITNVLPSNTLRNDYILQTYETTSTQEFCIVATQNNTTININMPVNSLGSIVQGQTHTITLQAGQLYLVKTGNESSSGISGTHVWSDDCSRFAVFTGAVCAMIPNGYNACDHLYEQAIPTQYWGKKFGIVPTATRTSDLIKITAKDDNTVVSFRGTNRHLNAGQSFSYENRYSAGGFYLTSNNPISVFLYLEGGVYAGTTGDPSMVVIHPLEQHIEEVTISSNVGDDDVYHYINLVTPASFRNDITIDGTPIPYEDYLPLIGSNAEFYYTTVNVPQGAHTIASSSGFFNAHMYGLNYYESYAYSAGTALDPIGLSAYLNGTSSLSINSSNNLFCSADTLFFSAQVLNEEECIFEWDLGDGTNSNERQVSHRYLESGTYNIKVRVQYADGCNNQFFDSCQMQVRIIQNPSSTTDTIVCDSLCYWMGNAYADTGIYSTRIPPTVGICDSILQLRITKMHTLPNPSIEAEFDCEQYQFVLHANGEGDCYRWSASPEIVELDEQQGDTTIWAPNDTARTYWLYNAYMDDSLCGNTDSITLPFVKKVKAVIGASTLLVDNINSQIILTDESINAITRNWNIDNENWGSRQRIDYDFPFSNFIVEVFLTAFNEYGCSDIDRVTIKKQQEDLWVPNVFTPSLTTNNLFKVEGVGITEYEIWIYDRRGSIVFHSTDILESWDGTCYRRLLQTGAYAYLIRYSTESEPNAHKNTAGTVTLLR